MILANKDEKLTSLSRSLNLVKAAQALLLLNTVIWLGIGLSSLLRTSYANPDRTIIIVIITILTFGNAAAMFVCGVGLGKQRRLFYFLALAVLTINIILTFTDQFGILDFITLVIDVIILGILILKRKQFSSPSRSAG